MKVTQFLSQSMYLYTVSYYVLSRVIRGKVHPKGKMSTAAFIIISYFYKGSSFVCTRGHTRSVYGVTGADFETDARHESCELRYHKGQNQRGRG